MKPRSQKGILLIAGCQRSGTSTMARIFHEDFQAKVYGEFSSLSSLDEHNIRLNPLPLVREQISEDKPPLIVLKPLVESQNLSKLLSDLPASKSLWMYRHYKDVASSFLIKFGTQKGIIDLEPIIRNDPNNWRSERVSNETRETVLKYFSTEMSPYDGAALFWYTRNILYFEANLQENPNVLLCHYDDMVTKPIPFIEHIYKFMELEFPGERIVSEIHPHSLGKGQKIELSEEIELLCQELFDRLNQLNQHQWAGILEN